MKCRYCEKEMDFESYEIQNHICQLCNSIIIKRDKELKAKIQNIFDLIITHGMTNKQ